MLIKLFPHGTGQGDKPTRYLVRMDYPGRDERPPQVLRGDPELTRALIDSIDRRWKFTAGVLAWHPDDKVSEEQEEEVMDAFEEVAFAGLEHDQRNILWVRHTHADHHELHFVIPRMELSSGNDFNACPPGWQKDFAVFRDLFNWKENWARPDDPARAREELTKKADLFKARMARWGKEIQESDRDKAKDEIHAVIKKLIEEGHIKNRADIIEVMKNLGLIINREGKDYVSVKTKDTDLKLRFKGGIYAENWKTENRKVIEETNEEQEEHIRLKVERLKEDYEWVIHKRAACNNKRYPPRWVKLEESEKLNLPEKETVHEPEPDRALIAPERPQAGSGLPDEGRDNVQENVRDGAGNERHKIGIADIKRYVSGCKRLVRELAELLRQIERRRMTEKAKATYVPNTRTRMR